LVSSGTNSATSGTGSKTSSGSATSTSNAAMPIATAQDMILGGAAVVVGLFVLRYGTSWPGGGALWM
jgi:hypothetical protein